jgi:hypothetical protein
MTAARLPHHAKPSGDRAYNPLLQILQHGRNAS